MSEEEAVEKYGIPSYVKERLWLYDGKEKLYIYFEDTPKIYLYPRFVQGYIGSPLEFKTLYDSGTVTDVTSQSELILDKPKYFDANGTGVLTPKKTGEYQVIAEYKGQYSNAGFISISESPQDNSSEERLLNIDIFPAKPYANVNTVVYFYAFGTFTLKGHYSVREITRQVDWFGEQDGRTYKLKESKVFLSSYGKYRVFCKYRGLRSASREISISTKPARMNKTLKQIDALPSNVYIARQTSVPFRAIASYEDNSVEEVTDKVRWAIKDKLLLERASDNVFAAKGIGITELQAVMGGLRSLPVKVVISGSQIKKKRSNKIRPQKKEKEELLEGIKEDVRMLHKKVTESNSFKYIKIAPSYCSLPAGSREQLLAFGVRRDNSEEDITILGEWHVSDPEVASVENGTIKAIVPGETKIRFKYKNMESAYIPVIVGEARLVSINISPRQLTLTKNESPLLQAEGYFGDSSHKDITSLAAWTSENPRTAKMERNRIRPARIGKTRIFAEYSGVKSIPADAEIVKEKYWLLKLLLKIAIVILSIMAALFLYSCLMIENAKMEILKLYADPRKLIIALYKNLQAITAGFGFKQQSCTPPLLLAASIDDKYFPGENLFLDFTRKYEEAKYSLHEITAEGSAAALDEYNRIVKSLLGKQKAGVLFYAYLKSYAGKIPFFIIKNG